MFNKQLIAKKFSRGAKNYDEFALTQKKAARNLAELTSPFIQKNSHILDLGSGTSFLAQEILKIQKDAKIFEVDIAEEMLKSWPGSDLKIQADLENLPFKNASFDIIISSFSLQWITNFEKNFSHFFSLLKPNGILAFCLPSDESLQELKSAEIFKFNDFAKSAELLAILEKCGFEKKIFKKELVKQNFKNGVEALISLKEIGASHHIKEKKILTKKHLKQFNNFCLKNFSTDHKNIAVSWNISYFLLSKKFK